MFLLGVITCDGTSQAISGSNALAAREILKAETTFTGAQDFAIDEFPVICWAWGDDV